MTVDRRWSAFWTAGISMLIGAELIALVVDGRRDTLSAQVWALVDWSPWVRTLGLAAFGAGAAWLAVHFFGHRG